MTTTLRPTFQKQGPATNCIIGGKPLGWSSCTAYAMAMGIDVSTFGVKTPSGCAVRRGTGDTTGGLTLNQVAYVADTVYGVKSDVRVGNNVVSPAYTALQLQAGRGAVLQGSSGAMLNTPFRSTGSAVNHAVWVNGVRGGKPGVPAEALVYDPAADGRSAGWGKADQGPSWWPWSLVLRFASNLHPWGEDDPRALGPGKFYVALLPDHEPHYHPRYGGQRPVRLPDRCRFADSDGWVHSKPDTSQATRIRRTKRGELFVVWQVAKGPLFEGSTDWGGNHTGTEWVARKRLNYWEGAT